VSSATTLQPCRLSVQKKACSNNNEVFKNLLDFKLNVQVKNEDKQAPMTDEERRKEEEKKINALYCNLYRFIHHEPID
jgi:hypothetical protein